MKLKLALFTVLFALLGSLMVSQVKMVNAQTAENSPLTSPITYFISKIMGNVVYKNLLTIKPAYNVYIYAFNVKTSEKYIAQTDINGNFTLSVKKGLYAVFPYDTNRTSFIPNYRSVDANKDVSNVSFIGIQILQYSPDSKPSIYYKN